jgi:4-amino-4-deoxychorismate lyase
MIIPILNEADIQKRLQERGRADAAASSYKAMYSSWLGGITRDPQYMFVPVDDHLVHRGDGVFEAIKFIKGQIYALTPHLERLHRSAGLIALEIPLDSERLTQTILQTIRASGLKTGMIRLYVSRGPGGFTTNPYDSLGSQLYIVITEFKPYAPNKYANGVKCGLSAIPVKEGFWANAKTCNYLPNVMMKKEAVDRGLDFTISLDESGFLAESSTENFALVNSRSELLIPSFTRTLRGITITRVMKLAEQLMQNGILKAVSERSLAQKEIANASEMFMIGTTLDVLPVVEFEGQKIGTGKPGPVARNLSEMIANDLKSGSDQTLSLLGDQ